MSMYHISPDGKGITCGICHNTSYHPKDIEHKYCGHCHAFHDGPDAIQKCVEMAVGDIAEILKNPESRLAVEAAGWNLKDLDRIVADYERTRP